MFIITIIMVGIFSFLFLPYICISEINRKRTTNNNLYLQQSYQTYMCMHTVLVVVSIIVVWCGFFSHFFTSLLHAQNKSKKENQEQSIPAMIVTDEPHSFVVVVLPCYSVSKAYQSMQTNKQKTSQ